MACEEHFLTSSSENFARRREGRSSALRVFFCISLSFSRGKGFLLSRALGLFGSEIQVIIAKRGLFGTRDCQRSPWKRLVFNHHRRTRTERERGNHHPLSHQIVLLLKSEFRDTKKSKPRVFFFGSAQFLSSRDTTLRLNSTLSYSSSPICSFYARARLASRKRIRSRERKKERKKERSEVKEEDKNEEPFSLKIRKKEQTRERF